MASYLAEARSANGDKEEVMPDSVFSDLFDPLRIVADTAGIRRQRGKIVPA
ncbi:hypothetical protein SDC9_202966 [bioreactor metagenome]|uniref:Uncharacterized protein n=1 Tax=bioreactor metagenome TaxID=1076179 RepID=A0A645J459_9ZZZZ